MDFDSFDELFPKGVTGVPFVGEKKDIELEGNGDSSEGEGASWRKIWGVSELLDELNVFLDMEFGRIWVEGEIGKVSVPSSGHRYFALKDENAALNAVCFRGAGELVLRHLNEGAHVLCLGRMNVYRARGTLQLIVEHAEPWGTGRLKLEFERLKKRLEDEGLFDPSLKKELPFWPERVFVITSPTGAAIRDFLKVARARAPFLNILLCPVRVQGEEARDDIIAALDIVEELASPNDVIVLTRGGGSPEDLWIFNDEALARRIFACNVPVISAIGHEIDFTICDFVADVRAPTPTAAAQLVCPSREELLEKIRVVVRRLDRAYSSLLNRYKKDLQLSIARLRHPRLRLMEDRLRLDEIEGKLHFLMQSLLSSKKEELQDCSRYIEIDRLNTRLLFMNRLVSEYRRRLHRGIQARVGDLSGRLMLLGDRLSVLNPMQGIQRGFAVLYDFDSGRMIRDASCLSRGQAIKLVLKGGEAIGRVEEVITHEET